jgi:predicted RNase H-like nuclease (RuvC/YqgF family)
MMKKCTRFLAAALLTVMTAPVIAVNKCVNDAGQVVYQTAPCPATAKGSELTLQKASQPSVTSAVDAEELKRIQQTAGKMERDRKLTEIDREISRLEGQIVDHRSAMNDQIASLQRKKQSANNNLAGATWEQSISDEMSAVSQKYDALIRNDQSRIDVLRADAERLRQTP